MTNKDQLTIRDCLERVRDGADTDFSIDIRYGRTIEEALKTIESLMLEVIGEEIPEIVIRENGDGSRIVQINPANELIKEQRERLKELLK